ncbi:THAP domain-containing protein 3 isoform X2 [Malaclemys terrapin pileata]|uniref:THAP domain-containing protein 3 isoform X2 n=1 Tax=Malaclemys terrapin pileata TaxID=2991368 RepID=UPI0023A83897|nr:THAP domain-containing protein 3 isoform X2 [Malaclemys terrapin pileata]
MPKSCAALRCSNRYSSRCRQQLTFHRFPFSRPELLARWVGNIGRGDFQPSSHTVLCSQHFQPDCFSAFGNRTNLKPNAVPTLFACPRTARVSRAGPSSRGANVEPRMLYVVSFQMGVRLGQQVALGFSEMSREPEGLVLTIANQEGDKPSTIHDAEDSKLPTVHLSLPAFGTFFFFNLRQCCILLYSTW